MTAATFVSLVISATPKPPPPPPSLPLPTAVWQDCQSAHVTYQSSEAGHFMHSSGYISMLPRAKFTVCCHRKSRVWLWSCWDEKSVRGSQLCSRAHHTLHSSSLVLRLMETGESKQRHKKRNKKLIRRNRNQHIVTLTSEAACLISWAPVLLRSCHEP